MLAVILMEMNVIVGTIPSLFYRTDFFNNPNYLCLTSCQWDRRVETDLFEASFNYINSIYNIYEIDEWPKFLPPPPIPKSN